MTYIHETCVVGELSICEVISTKRYHLEVLSHIRQNIFEDTKLDLRVHVRLTAYTKIILGPASFVCHYCLS